MTDYNLGTARGTIEIEYKGDGARKAREDLNQTRKAADDVNPSVKNAASTAGKSGLVIAAGFALAARSASNFESQMSAIGAVSGASGAELDSLRDKALQLGKDTQFSAAESAAAIEELIKAGLSVEDVLNGAADATVNLAAAGAVDMPTAATIASNAMNQFNLKAEDMVGVVDNIAGAANASAIDVNEFGMSLSQVGAVANLAGANFEDTATAIALMGNAGIKGSDAGTSLKTFLNNLQPVTKKQIELFKELGIVTKDGSNQFYDAQGNLKSLADVSGVLQNALKGMTKQQKQATLEAMFGSDAIRAAAVLSNNGAEGFNKMADSMSKVSAADVAAKRMDNFKGSLEQFMGSLETLGIVIGTMVLPTLRSLVDGLTAAANWFLDLPSSVQTLILAVIGIVGASLLALSAFVKIVGFLKMVKAAFIAVRAAAIPAWLAALGPIALVIAGIALVAGALYLLWKKSETFRDIVTAVWDAVKSAALAVADWFTGPFVDFFVGLWDAIVGIFNGIKSAVMTYVNVWVTIIKTGLAVLGAIWNAFWGVFGGVIKAVFGLIAAIVRLGWTVIKGLFLLNLRLILAVVRGVWNAIKTATSATWNAITAVIRAVWGAIGGTVMGAVNRVKSLVQAAWDAIKSVTSRVWNALTGVISAAIDKFLDPILRIKDRVLGALAGAGRWLYDKGREIIQGLLDGIESMIGAVTDKINAVTDKIGKFLPGSPVREGPLKVLNRGYAGKQIVKMVLDGIGTMENDLNTTVKNMLAVPAPALSDDLTRLYRSAALGSAPLAGAAGAPVSGPSKVGSGGTATLVEGRLSIDRSGRAFIRGVAIAENNDDNDFADTLGRMR